jgi:hypothetical protein
MIFLVIGFHNRPNNVFKDHIRIFSILSNASKEKRLKFGTLIQMNAGAQGRPKTAATTAIQQGIGILNERYRNNEIDLQELLDVLSTVVAKQHK